MTQTSPAAAQRCRRALASGGQKYFLPLVGALPILRARRSQLNETSAAAVAQQQRPQLIPKKSQHMMHLPENEDGFGPEAELELQKLYTSFGADTTERKITVLTEKLGGKATIGNFSAFGGCPDPGQPTPAMILACLEYEWLSSEGLIKLTLA